MNATAEMLKEHILPVADKLKDQASKMEKEEAEFYQDKRHRAGDEQDCAILEVRPV